MSCDVDDLKKLTPSLDCLMPGDVIESDYSERKILAVQHNAVLPSIVNDFDYSDIWWTPKQLKNNDYSFKDHPTTKTKLSIDEIAGKFGIAVEDLEVIKE